MKRALRTLAPFLPRSTAHTTRLHHPRIPYSHPRQLPFPAAFARSARRYSTQPNPPSSSVSAKACPSCGAPLDLTDISCAKCGALSPLPENINYLSLFGISAEQPFKFDIDVGKLKSEYVKLMTKVHPDSVINESDVFPLAISRNILQHVFYIFPLSSPFDSGSKFSSSRNPFLLPSLTF